LGKTFYIDNQGDKLPRPNWPFNRYSYQVEVLTSSPTKRHVCIFCEKAFQSPNALRTHKNSHTGEK
ncbi:14711_t:CDS:2, partial [Acaulospora morrowiae]